MSTSTSSTQKKKFEEINVTVHECFVELLDMLSGSRGYVPYSHVFMKYWEKLLLSGGFTAKYDMAILVTSDKVRGLTTVLTVGVGALGGALLILAMATGTLGGGVEGS
ncbi:21875_t:CDS:2 [Rhizophagus irregularis]|nr:21875_t:CDS:2 [Rhizophagus irregularis]